jgi:hypothetical protein
MTEAERTLRAFLGDKDFGDELWNFAVFCWLGEHPELPKRVIRRFHRDARELHAHLAKTRREAQRIWTRAHGIQH